jgi:DNA repair protein RecO (recombination protein O)
MPRSYTYTALTLRVKPSGESNREAWFLSAEEGLLRATVFGGPKSRLRALASPFHSGTLWIYHDPVRDSRKVSDFDVQLFRTGLRELWERAMAAGAVAETILSSHGGGGGWSEAFNLAGNVLDALETADAESCSRIGIYFLWHWAGHLGLKPDLAACASCSRETGREDQLWYSTQNEAFFCERCLKTEAVGPALHVGPGARLWLNKTESLSTKELPRVTLDAPSLEQARALSKTVLAAALGKWLPTWEGI